MNLRVSLIAMAALSLAIGLALAAPAGPATGKPLPAVVFTLAVQAGSRLPGSQHAATLSTSTVPRSPGGYPLLLGTGADRNWPVP